MKLFLLTIFISSAVTAQTRVNVKSNYALKNYVRLAPRVNAAYQTPELVQDSVEVKDNRFSFQIKKIPDSFYYPYGFSNPIGSSAFVLSSEIYLNSEHQNLIIDPQFNIYYKDENSVISKDLKRFLNYLAAWEAAKDAKHAELSKKIEAETDVVKRKILVNDYFKIDQDFEINKLGHIRDYVEQYPGSVVGFWETVLHFERNGFQPILNEVLSLFDASIKKENAYKVFVNRVNSSKTLAIGQVFPNAKLKNISGSQVQIVLPKNKYTLVDFWFSHCAPCLEEMPKHIALYNRYRNKGYGIVGVAVDQKSAYANLVKTVRKFNIPWTNYWDENRGQSAKWMVNSFPTTYLLDDKRKIIAKNMTIEELDKFLSDKL